jgi:hypothetical protein
MTDSAVGTGAGAEWSSAQYHLDFNGGKNETGYLSESAAYAEYAAHGFVWGFLNTDSFSG